MIDAEAGPTSRDKKIAAKIIKAERGCLLLINKWDLTDNAMQEITQTKYLPALQNALPFLNFAPVLFMSAKSGYNIKRTIDAIDYVAAQTRTEITTGILNRVIQKAVEKFPPPQNKGRETKDFLCNSIGKQPNLFQNIC